MATESAVTPDRAHPFTAGQDFCLVHNGSLSNPNMVRRSSSRAASASTPTTTPRPPAASSSGGMREGDDLRAALAEGLRGAGRLLHLPDGHADRAGAVRDPFACKPAVVAETDDYVAIASEFRSLAHLPGVNARAVFEPAPEEMYVWTLTDRRRRTLDLRPARTTVRALNQFLHGPAATWPAAGEVHNTDGAHNLAVGLNARCTSRCTATPATTPPA
jgi:glutamine phosphoribosylpyrophosphate amidotransferase